MMFTARDRLKLLAGAGLAALAACGGGGGGSSRRVNPAPPPPPSPSGPGQKVLRDVYAGKFAVGAAIGTAQLEASSRDRDILLSQFSSLTAENVMKPATLAPSRGQYDFAAADAIVDFAQANGMQVRGHTLLWHRQTPDWFFGGDTAEVRARLEDYVTLVVSRYRGKVSAWDVVNEVASDDAGARAPYRDSNWYRAVGGPDFIEWAFRAARAADPDAKLFINDYNTEYPDKRDRLLQIVQDLLAKGVPIDGVGHQLHMDVGNTAEQALDAVRAVDSLGAGLINHVTELDISVYDDPPSCFFGGENCEPDVGIPMPAEIARKQSQLYRDLFDGFAGLASLQSVTFWGVSDAQTWLNTFPAVRRDHPLLYDRQRQAKSAFHAVTDPAYVIS